MAKKKRMFWTTLDKTRVPIKALPTCNLRAIAVILDRRILECNRLSDELYPRRNPLLYRYAGQLDTWRKKITKILAKRQEKGK